MKRYMVFARNKNALCNGGARDFYAGSDNIEEAKISLRLAQRSFDWAHLVDWETMNIYFWDKKNRKLRIATD